MRTRDREPLRPGYHFTAARHWLNDPNGLVWHDGEYHLFFQHNPLGSQWGNMSWGHAVSRDLWHWEELPVALAFTEDEHVFSGSVVVDHHDTSGLGAPGRPPMVALYTSHDPRSERPRQAQSLASSTDGGRTWTRYPGNPVLDIGSADFRDPKVFWYEPGGHWVMAVALAADRVVQLYRSPDLIRWEHLSDFGPAGSTDGIWECPDLFPLPVDDDPGHVRWVLLVSVQSGAPAGGSGLQYFVGDFDGMKFTADQPVTPDTARWVDHGADHYAAVSFSGLPDNERVVIGWMSNWDYAHHVPGDEFRGAMSLPRRYSLTSGDNGLSLRQRPVYPGTVPLPLHRATPGPVAHGVHPLPDECHGTRLRIVAEIEAGSAERVGLHVRTGPGPSDGTGQRTVVGYDVGTRTVFVDRTASGRADFDPRFAAVHVAPYPHTAGSDLRSGDATIRLEVWVDSTSVEVFAGHGETTLSDLVYPDPEAQGLAVFAENGTAHLRSLTVERL